MKPLLLVLLVAVGLSSARWLRKQRSDQNKEACFVGKATYELSTTMLQGYLDDDTNIAFSPLGYSAILAILAEGATGETRNELISALHLPEDQNLTRKTYKNILERLKYRNEYKYNQPELKNFFYIYKNYTINEDYKKILEDYYLTDVRSIERQSSIGDFDSEENEPEMKEEAAPKTEEVSDLIPPQESNEQLFSYAVKDTPEKVYKPAKNIKEQIKLVKTIEDKKDNGDEEETMVAVEARNHARSLQVLNQKNDIASSISVNSVGEKSSKSVNSLMLIFNGMYFRGSWKKSFDKIEPGLFYKSSSEKKLVPMMKTRGTFLTSSLPDLDSEAILLPYDGDRYALILLVPRSRDGLVRLVADLPDTTLSEIQESLREEELEVSVPTFYVETTTKPVTTLAKFGVSSIFGHEAELSGISSKEGLFVQELVQNVAVRVDNTDASAASISASNAVGDIEAIESELKSLPLFETKGPRRFCVERPFVFYIIDRLEGLVVVTGKIIDPQLQNDV
ncbi:serine protease inhibitor 3/4 [Danaus plexippus]|uniref:serine protease inhibitor 3/4 n=1 Tax=Danaus plexippus TaxID=13037 RepID=UPI002AB1951C|nr:serine protease inhibitor 3/4 [Danaus plexippus]